MSVGIRQTLEQLLRTFTWKSDGGSEVCFFPFGFRFCGYKFGEDELASYFRFLIASFVFLFLVFLLALGSNKVLLSATFLGSLAFFFLTDFLRWKRGRQRCAPLLIVGKNKEGVDKRAVILGRRGSVLAVLLTLLVLLVSFANIAIEVFTYKKAKILSVVFLMAFFLFVFSKSWPLVQASVLAKRVAKTGKLSALVVGILAFLPGLDWVVASSLHGFDAFEYLLTVLPIIVPLTPLLAIYTMASCFLEQEWGNWQKVLAAFLFAWYPHFLLPVYWLYFFWRNYGPGPRIGGYRAKLVPEDAAGGPVFPVSLTEGPSNIGAGHFREESFWLKGRQPYEPQEQPAFAPEKQKRIEEAWKTFVILFAVLGLFGLAVMLFAEFLKWVAASGGWRAWALVYLVAVFLVWKLWPIVRQPEEMVAACEGWMYGLSASFAYYFFAWRLRKLSNWSVFAGSPQRLIWIFGLLGSVFVIWQLLPVIRAAFREKARSEEG